jgi:chemotaxis regulatin CheY-phosphate phosphatase CheZ
MDAYDHRVNERFKEWQLRRADLRDQSQRLEKAMRKYVDGSEPMPDDLASQVHELRKECDALFRQVLEAMNDRTRAREQRP